MCANDRMCVWCVCMYVLACLWDNTYMYTFCNKLAMGKFPMVPLKKKKKKEKKKSACAEAWWWSIWMNYTITLLKSNSTWFQFILNSELMMLHDAPAESITILISISLIFTVDILSFYFRLKQYSSSLSRIRRMHNNCCTQILIHHFHLWHCYQQHTHVLIEMYHFCFYHYDTWIESDQSFYILSIWHSLSRGIHLRHGLCATLILMK